MSSKKLFTIRNAAFVLLFIALTLVGNNIKLSAIWGAPDQSFTLFQTFGPLPGFFLGPVLGITAVLVSELISFFMLGKAINMLNLLLLLPMLGGAYVFATFGKQRLSLAIPVLAIILFNLSPVGREAWVYSMFWLIPIICELFFKKSLFFRALGSTFTAHAIGGSFWNYFATMTPQMWIALIPVTAVERLVFATGITVSFVAVNTIMNRYFADARFDVPNVSRYISLI
jgi:hypothetical protein